MTDQFTYVSAFLSIVVALAMTHLLGGVAAIIRGKVARYSLVYFAWIGLLLFGCVDFWFSLWGLHAQVEWPLPFVMFLLLAATLLYLTCHLIVPDDPGEGGFDLVAFVDGHRRRYIAALFLYILCGTVANLLIAGFADAVWINGATLVLLAVAWIWRDARIQGAVALALIALFGYYAVNFIPALR